MLLLSAFKASAQIEVLDSFRVAADPLLKEEGRMELRSQHVVVEIYDNGAVKWWLRNPPHIFVGDKMLNGRRKATAKGRLGVYKEDGTLLASTDDWKGYPAQHGSYMEMYAKAKVKNSKGDTVEPTILDILLNTKLHPNSYIRVVMPVLGDYLMDVKFRIPDRWYVKQQP